MLLTKTENPSIYKRILNLMDHSEERQAEATYLCASMKVNVMTFLVALRSIFVKLPAVIIDPLQDKALWLYETAELLPMYPSKQWPSHARYRKGADGQIDGLIVTCRTRSSVTAVVEIPVDICWGQRITRRTLQDTVEASQKFISETLTNSSSSPKMTSWCFFPEEFFLEHCARTVL